MGQTHGGLEAGAGQSHPSVLGESPCPLHPQGQPEVTGHEWVSLLCQIPTSPPAILPDIPQAWCGVSPTCPPSSLETPAFPPTTPPLTPTRHHLLNKEVGTVFPGRGYPGTFLLPPLGQDKGLLQNLGEEQPGLHPILGSENLPLLASASSAACLSPAPSSLKPLLPRTWPRSPDPPIRPEGAVPAQPSDWPPLPPIVALVPCPHPPPVLES